MNLTHKHRDAQTLAGCLTRQELLLPVRQSPALPIMLRAFVCEEAGAQKHRMLAVLLPQRIDTFVQVGVRGATAGKCTVRK